jgi:hypothetical protein
MRRSTFAISTSPAGSTPATDGRLGTRAGASSRCHRLIALRDELAPHVLLAWHLSVWGTDEDPTYSKPSLAHMDQLAADGSFFYRLARRYEQHPLSLTQPL